ncbi:GNAT family N-acetyltransferase [Kineosporia babensis]|uniref:GNAT family N-acetyltransferase n=1 Tax=Kineosporia babensis TaxID=499548 RepID=A0A9X1NFE9_9ACTN|nr:GNAT family N-acetyltransferase [Kineosporia babensis]MCD5312884.1 GNAT family N-acetyltransferase [Kineosporia babensis]
MVNLVKDVVPAGSWGSLAQPGFAGAGLVVRPWQPGDEGFLLSAYADPDIRRWHAMTLSDRAEATAWIETAGLRWAQEQGANWAVTEDGQLLGRIGFRMLDLAGGEAEVAYWVAPQARGRRVATRALGALIGWARSQGLHRLTLMHSTLNLASCKVAQHCGFRDEGTSLRSVLHEDGWHDMHHHALLLE